MKIKSYFIIWSMLIVSISIGVAIQTYKYGLFALILTEVFFLFILVFLFLFYKRVIYPFQVLANGTELLKEQDFTSRLRKVQQADADRLVDIFNMMIDQLKSKQLRLQEQNYFLERLINSSPLGILILSLDGKITSANPMFLQQSGFDLSKLTNRTLESFNTPLFKQLAILKKNESEVIIIDSHNIYKCTHSSFLDKGFRHSFYLIENLTEEVHAAERKGYEKVIRMMAHEVNNAIAGITSTLDCIGENMRENEDETPTVQLLQHCINRSNSLGDFVTRLADVVKIPAPHFQPSSLNVLIERCIQAMYTFCKEKEIVLQKQSHFTEEVIVRMDPVMMEQVVTNIIKNSAESIEHKGTITLSILNKQTIDIIDNGKGIDQETQKQLFTPFFSSKQNGQGIGLMIIKEILIKHRCNYSLQTMPDGLTHFRIEFPNDTIYLIQNRPAES